MTICECCVDHLVSHLVWPEEANEIMQYAMTHDMLKPLAGRWGEQVDCFPSMMVNLCLGSIKVVALEWLKVNCPQHIAIQRLESN